MHMLSNQYKWCRNGKYYTQMYFLQKVKSQIGKSRNSGNH